jgi:hypothetical protein
MKIIERMEITPAKSRKLICEGDAVKVSTLYQLATVSYQLTFITRSVRPLLPPKDGISYHNQTILIPPERAPLAPHVAA